MILVAFQQPWLTFLGARSLKDTFFFVHCLMTLLLLCFSIMHSIDLFMYGRIDMCDWMIVYAVDN